MKLITVVIIVGVFTITTAVRVPSAWTKNEDGLSSPRTRTSEIASSQRPHVGHVHKQRQINSKHQNARHPNPKAEEFKASATTDGWKPLVPVYIPKEHKTKQFYQNYQSEQTPDPIYRTIIEKNPQLYQKFRTEVSAEQKNRELFLKQKYNKKPIYRNLPDTQKSPQLYKDIKVGKPIVQINPNVHKKFQQQKPIYQSNTHNQENSRRPYLMQKQTNQQIYQRQPIYQNQQQPIIYQNQQQPVMYQNRPQPIYHQKPYQLQQPQEKPAYYHRQKVAQPQKHPELYKNYRDDRTHEPANEPEPYRDEEPEPYRDDETHEPVYETESVEEKHTHRETPHELSLDVPTKPIYPGEGQWAKRGPHKPFVSKHNFPAPEEDLEKPEGYETFEQLQEVFNRQSQRFQQKFPSNHKPEAASSAPNHKIESDDDEESANEEEDEEEEEFVPLKLYTQIRRTETEEHLPQLIEDPRLKEVVKDSKIQTVYTEEGYEDVAYDHAGHEKEAEEDEGYTEFGKGEEKEKGKDDDSDTAGSVKKPLKVKKDKLMKTGKVKTMEIKEKEDGKQELEVKMEVETLETPFNSTKTQKILKIYPKEYRYDKVATQVANETTTTTTTTTTTEKIDTLLDPASFDFKRIKKRSTEFTDFIDKINHNIPKVQKIVEKPKYPYYDDPTLHSYSPLRYAEDLENIPRKTEDDFAFYNQADKIECQEVETTVDPIPERIRNADEDPEEAEETSDVQELPKTPRLRNLGDKIDCFKVKYFGENPLDSPFFQEKEIEPVKPLFNFPKKDKDSEKKYSARIPQKRIKQVAQSSISNTVTQNIFKDVTKNLKSTTEKLPEIVTEQKVMIITPETTTYRNLVKSAQNNVENLHILNDAVPSTTQQPIPVNVFKDITKQVKPIHRKQNPETHLNILKDVTNQFQQPSPVTEKIQPLIHKFTLDDAVTAKQETATVESKTVKNEPEAVVSIITTPKYTIDLTPKHIYDQIQLLEYLPVYNKTASSTDRLGKSIEEQTTTTTPASIVPESQPLMFRRRFRVRNRPTQKPPQIHIFDVNQYLPPPVNTYLPKGSFNFVNNKVTTTTAPKVDVQENDIKAREQLNVFADVINNIKNSSRNQDVASSNQIGIRTNLLDSYRKIPVDEPENNEDVQHVGFYLTTTVSPRGSIKYSSYKKPNRDTKITHYENLELLKVKKQRTTTTIEPYSSDTRISSIVSAEEEEGEEEDEEEEEEEEEETTQKVLGLMPPVPNRYKTIISPQSPYQMNLFHVVGMKPPIRQKPYLYSDFKRPHRKQNKNFIRRARREAQRPAYSEVVRNRNKPIDVEDDIKIVIEEDDDYVPHRPKNYHYDEKTGRIIYDKVETEAPEILIEVTEAPIPKPTKRTSATTQKYEINGPSYVDFISKLKSDPKYAEITDPPPTEKSNITTTTTTAKPVSTTPPEFLGFLSKLRNDSNYKALPDKTTTTTTTTAAPEVVEETQENVQNARGGQNLNEKFNIFDINEYLPKVRNYTPVTSIDYSKYKTIERTNVPRHNLSSRYDAEEEDLKNVKTTRVPIMQNEKIVEINPEMSESKIEEREPASTSTVPSTTTKRIRVRTRSRPTKRSTTTAPTTSTSTTSTEPTAVTSSKPKRVFPRRRPTRIKITTTSELPPTDTEIEESNSAVVVRRVISRRSDTEKKYKIAMPSKEEVANLNKTSDVEVFRKFDKTKKHGGNYRKVDEVKNEEAKRLSDVNKPASFYKDPKLPKKINQLMEGTGDGGVELEEKEDQTEEESFEYEEVTTQKPTFIKDPEKRLYFYAPI